MSEPEPGMPADMLIDRYLPRFDTTLIEHTVAEADLATVWQALRELDLMRVHTPLTDAAMFARGVPARVASRFGHRPPPEPAPRRLTLTGDGPQGWLSLGERAEREIALGAIGQFWKPDIEWYDVSTMTPEQFAAFAEPDWGRIGANFSLRPYGTPRTLISYEARTSTGSPGAARRFAHYWALVRPFARHLMRATLEELRKDAEARSR